MSIKKNIFLILILCLPSPSRAADSESPSVEQIRAFIESKNSAALRYYWPDLNAKLQNQTVQQMLASKEASAPEWREFYQNKLERLLQNTSPPKDESNEAFNLLKAMEGGKTPTSANAKLILNKLVAREIPSLQFSQLAKLSERILTPEEKKIFAPYFAANERLASLLEVNLISAFQEMSDHSKRPSLPAVSAIMRADFDPEHMTWLSAPDRAGILDQISKVESLTSRGRLDYVSVYRLEPYGKISETSLRPFSMQLHPLKPQVVKATLREAQKIAIAENDLYTYARNSLQLQRRGLNAALDSPKASAEMLHHWIQTSPSEVQSFLDETVVTQKQMATPSSVNEILDAVAYDVSGTSPMAQIEWMKKNLLERDLKLSPSAERMFWSASNLKALYQNEVGYPDTFLKRAAKQFQTVLGNDAYQETLKLEASEGALLSRDALKRQRLFGIQKMEILVVGQGKKQCGILSNLRKYLFGKKVL